MTFGRGLAYMLAWVAIGLALVTGFAFRDEVGYVARRVYAVLVPGAAVVGPRQEVTIARVGRGGFELRTQVNGADATMVFDTGASTVVLTPQTARAAGIELADLDYSVRVSTANGVTTAAPVTIDKLSIGPISERRVRALVAREGQLFENLLGMSFLSRLESYQVQGDRLILRGRTGGTE